MKRFLVIIMSIAMVLTLIPSMAYADNGLTAGMLVSSSVYTGYEQTIPDPKVSYNGVEIPKNDTNGYKIEWKDSKDNVVPGGKVTKADTYTGTVKYTPSLGTEQTATVTYTVEKLNMGDASFKIAYGSDPMDTDISTFTGFAALAVNAPVSNGFNAGKVKITAGSSTVSNDLFDIAATKVNDYQFRVSVSLKVGTQYTDNVFGVNRNEVFSLTTKLDNSYKIIGTSADGSIPDQVYTGTALQPTIYVVPKGNTGYNTSGALSLNSDYTVEYKDNINVGGPIATVTVKAKEGSRYTGSLQGTFRITPKSISYVSVSTGYSVAGYEPIFNVTDGSNALVKGTDYTLLPGYGPISVGSSTGKFTIQGIGNYKDTKETTYSLAANNIASAQVVASAYGNQMYNGNVITPSTMPVLKFGNSTLTLNSDYSLEYRYRKDGKLYSTTSPKDAYSYDVYALGRGTYGGEKPVGTLNITKVPFIETSGVTITVSQGPSETKPKVVIKGVHSNVTFVEGTDYTFTYAYYKELGRGSVTIKSKGTGNLAPGPDIIKTYSVSSKYLPAAYFYEYVSGSGYTTTTSKTYQWTGYSFTIPQIRVMDGTSLLTEGVHYTVAVKDAAGKAVSSIKDTGTYTVTVTGTGMYMGSQTLAITVKGVSITGYAVTLSKTTEKATGFNISLPTVTSVKSATRTLSTYDYDVKYMDPDGKATTMAKLAGTYKVIVTGKGGYEGTAEATFVVTGDKQDVTTAYSKYSRIFNGQGFSLDAKATAGGALKYVSSDSAIASVDNSGNVTIGRKVGVAKITVTAAAIGKFEKGEKIVSVTVRPTAGVINTLKSNGKKKVKVFVAKQAGVESYQVMYSTSSKFTNGRTATIYDNPRYTKSQSKTIKGLLSGRRYYVKVRSVYTDANGMKAYGSWSTVRSVRVK